MKINRKIIIPTLLILCAIGLIVLGVKNGNKSEQLVQQREQILQLEQQLSTQKTLLTTDSLLVQGKYEDALRQYTDYSEQPIEDEKVGIALRMAIANKFLEFENQTQQQRALLNSSLDSAELAETEAVDPLQTNQVDSLTFALSKAKMQLSKLKRQLHKKSFGEYLTFTNAKGSQVHYVGKVEQGKANGYGVAILNTGSRYVGEWKNNQRHGQGTFYWKDGEYYEGNYENDKRNGQGTYYWPNGEKYVGQWKDDRRSGKGAFFGKDGKLMTKGIWEDDKMVTSQAKPRKQRNKEKTVAAL